MTNTERIQANNEELREAIRIAENLPDAGSGGEVAEPVIEPLFADENGTYEPPIGVDGYSPVTVNVPIPEGYIVPSETLDIAQNGEYNIAEYEFVDVNVPIPDGYIQPSGTKEITENGTHDAKAYESVSVNVPIPDGYIVPRGELEVTENGIHDVTEYASVNVSVPTGGGTSDLPEGYERCDYIQFSGGNFVDTGIIGNQDTQIFASFTWENSTQRYLLGCAHADNTAAITAYMNGSWRFGDKTASKSISVKNPLLPYSALLNKTTIAVTSGVTAISGVNDFETVGTLLFGACRSSNGNYPSTGIVGKGLRLIIWQDGERVLDLMPVTNGNGEYRFWDTVGKKFHDSMTSTPLDGGNW